MFEVEFRQTLYWVNVPGVTDNLDWLGHFIPDYLNCLIESGNPTLIYTGIKNIDFNLYTKDCANVKVCLQDIKICISHHNNITADITMRL